MYVKVTRLTNGKWKWVIVARNGAAVARSPCEYTRKWTAVRAVNRLLGYFGCRVGEFTNGQR